jgi:hypothetical protein
MQIRDWLLKQVNIARDEAWLAAAPLTPIGVMGAVI